MKVKFTCSANVGKPPGKIKWWRYRFGITAPQRMGESTNSPQVQPKVCVYNVTSSIEHTMTSDDDQSVWRCSVDNELLTTSPDQNKPNEESMRVNVYCKYMHNSASLSFYRPSSTPQKQTEPFRARNEPYRAKSVPYRHYRAESIPYRAN
jgi:hypothetical protein